MSHHHGHHDHGGHQHDGKHKDEERLGHVVAVLDRLSNVVTADLVVDFGVFLTGVTLIILELGLVPHRPLEDDPQPQPAHVRTVPNSGH